jgi:hypothetical protein
MSARTPVPIRKRRKAVPFASADSSRNAVRECCERVQGDLQELQASLDRADGMQLAGVQIELTVFGERLGAMLHMLGLVEETASNAATDFSPATEAQPA